MCKGLAQSRKLTKCFSFSMLLAANQKSGELRSEHSEKNPGMRQGRSIRMGTKSTDKLGIGKELRMLDVGKFWKGFVYRASLPSPHGVRGASLSMSIRLMC